MLYYVCMLWVLLDILKDSFSQLRSSSVDIHFFNHLHQFGPSSFPSCYFFLFYFPPLLTATCSRLNIWTSSTAFRSTLKRVEWIWCYYYYYYYYYCDYRRIAHLNSVCAPRLHCPFPGFCASTFCPSRVAAAVKLLRLCQWLCPEKKEKANLSSDRLACLTLFILCTCHNQFKPSPIPSSSSIIIFRPA